MNRDAPTRSHKSNAPCAQSATATQGHTELQGRRERNAQPWPARTYRRERREGLARRLRTTKSESVPTGSVGGSRAPGSAPPRSHEAHHEISGPGAPHTCNTTNQVEQPNTDTNRDTNRRPPGSRARANCENTRKSKHTLTPKQVTPEIATARRR